jgi:hypothetical protein
MSNYSKEEIVEFKAKDLRISKLAIVKSLIEKLPLEDIYEVEKVKELAEKYIDYVYEERSAKRGQVASVGDETKQTPDWEQIAVGLNLAIPTSQNVKILDCVCDEYKKANKASANPKDVLTCCIEKFGTYPTKSSSAEKVVKLLKG